MLPQAQLSSNGPELPLISSSPPPCSLALQLPELLYLTFTCLKISDVVPCARVCQKWSEVAIPLIWQKLPLLPRDLLEILGPLESDANSVSISQNGRGRGISD